jgi:hypothetical protein
MAGYTSAESKPEGSAKEVVTKPVSKTNLLQTKSDDTKNQRTLASSDKSTKTGETSTHSSEFGDDTEFTADDLDDLMKEDQSQDTEDLSGNSGNKKTKIKKDDFDLSEEDNWMKMFSEEIGSELSSDSLISKKSNKEAQKKVQQQQPLDFEDDDTSEANIKAKIEILEITASNWASYTEMQILVKYLEEELQVKHFGDKDTFLTSDFDQRKSKLDKDTLADIQLIEEYLKKLGDEKRQKFHDEIINNMAGISELSNSEETSASQESHSNKSNMVHSLSEVSNPLKGQKESKEMDDLFNMDLPSKNNSMKDDFGGLNSLFNGGKEGMKGLENLGNLMKMMGSLAGTKGGEAGTKEDSKKDTGFDFAKMAKSFADMMKNPEMAKMMKEGDSKEEKGSGESKTDLFKQMENEYIPKDVQNKELDEEMEGNMNSLLKEELNQKPLTQKQKWDRIRKENKIKKKLAKRGLGMAKKVAFKGNYLAKPMVEKVTVNKKTGDKDLFIDFGEGQIDEISSGDKKKEDKKAKEEPKKEDNPDIVNVFNFDRSLNVSGLNKIGKYVKSDQTKKDGVLLLV